MTKKKMTWLGGSLIALLGLAAGRAEAANPSYLNIDVTITNAVSVAVNNIQVSSQSVTWSGQSTLTNTTPVAIKNDSAYYASQWRFSTTANSIDATNGSNGWTIGSAGGTDQVGVQAALGPSGLASCASADFTSGTVTPQLSNTTPITYTASVLANTTALGAGSAPDNTSTNKMNAGSIRQLCWNLKMPTSTSFTNQQIVPVIVTAF